MLIGACTPMAVPIVRLPSVSGRKAAMMLHHTKRIPIVIVMTHFGHVCYGFNGAINDWIGMTSTLNYYDASLQVV